MSNKQKRNLKFFFGGAGVSGCTPECDPEVDGKQLTEGLKMTPADGYAIIR